MLEIEQREGGREILDAIALAGTQHRADCNCALGYNAPCSWKSASDLFKTSKKTELLKSLL